MGREIVRASRKTCLYRMYTHSDHLLLATDFTVEIKRFAICVLVLIAYREMYPAAHGSPKFSARKPETKRNQRDPDASRGLTTSIRFKRDQNREGREGGLQSELVSSRRRDDRLVPAACAHARRCVRVRWCRRSLKIGRRAECETNPRPNSGLETSSEPRALSFHAPFDCAPPHEPGN